MYDCFEYNRVQQVASDTVATDETNGRQADAAHSPECQQTLADIASSRQLCASRFFYFDSAYVEAILRTINILGSQKEI